MKKSERLEKLDVKLDKVIEHIANIDTTLAKQSVILDEHVKRSTQLEDRMEPVEKHVVMINGVLKFLGLLAAIAAIIEGFAVLFK